MELGLIPDPSAKSGPRRGPSGPPNADNPRSKHLGPARRLSWPETFRYLTARPAATSTRNTRGKPPTTNLTTATKKSSLPSGQRGKRTARPSAQEFWKLRKKGADKSNKRGTQDCHGPLSRKERGSFVVDSSGTVCETLRSNNEAAIVGGEDFSRRSSRVGPRESYRERNSFALEEPSVPRPGERKENVSLKNRESNREITAKIIENIKANASTKDDIRGSSEQKGAFDCDWKYRDDEPRASIRDKSPPPKPDRDYERSKPTSIASEAFVEGTANDVPDFLSNDSSTITGMNGSEKRATTLEPLSPRRLRSCKSRTVDFHGSSKPVRRMSAESERCRSRDYQPRQMLPNAGKRLRRSCSVDYSSFFLTNDRYSDEYTTEVDDERSAVDKHIRRSNKAWANGIRTVRDSVEPNENIEWSSVGDDSGKSGKSAKSLEREVREERNSGKSSAKERSWGKNETKHARTIIPRKEEEAREPRRVTRGSTKTNKDNFVGKLVWGFCSGWWPAVVIDAEHVGMLPEEGKLWVYWIGEARISLLNEKTQVESFTSNLKCRLAQTSNVLRVKAIDATMQMIRNRFGCTLTKPYATWIQNNFSELYEPLDEIKFYPYPPRIQQRLDDLKAKNAKVTKKFLQDQKRSPNQGKKSAEKLKESAQRNNVDLTRLPLREQHPGVITWAKIAGHNWWPAMIIDYRDCCMREPSFGCQWIMWYGDYKLSEVHHHLFIKFDKGIEKMHDYIQNTKKHVFLVGVLQAAKDYCTRCGCETDNWTLTDALKYFSTINNVHAPHSALKSRDSVKIYDKYSAHIVKKLNELKNNPNIDDQRRDDIKNSEDLRSVRGGSIALETLCLKCLKIFDGKLEMHPFFEGSLCKECSEQFKPRMFVFGNDEKCFYCTVCAGSGTVIICDKEDCPRVYCTACMKHLLCPNTYDQVLLEDPWECFLCKHESCSLSDMAIKPRPNWKDKIIDMFRTTSNSNVRLSTQDNGKKRKIRVLSLFDGLSTGLLVLLKLGLDVGVYYASEIDKDALMVSASHFGDRIIHLGNVKDITKEKIKEMAPIDLLIGGSPCNDLSLANPARLGLYDPKGTGILFFEYCRIMKLLKKCNNGHHLFWMYENVASMPTEYRLEINRHLAQEPDVIDSADFSPQHRLRLYWHNLPIEPHSLSLHFQGEQDVQDILTPHCQRYALVKKIRTVTTKVNSLKQGKSALKPILMKDESDTLWITELEEIFGFPRHYTDVKNLSATKRQKLIGKSWSVQTLTAILQSIRPFFETNGDTN